MSRIKSEDDGPAAAEGSPSPACAGGDPPPSSPSGPSSGSSGDWSGGSGVLPGRDAVGPLLLMITTPAFSVAFWYTVTNLDGHFLRFMELCWEGGLITTLISIWPSWRDPTAWRLIGTFLGFELVLMRAVPGREFTATVTPTGNRPVYKANGTACYLITLGSLLVLTYLDLIRPALVYDKFGEILSSMNVLALLVCLVLLIKGHVAPSSADSGTNGNVVMDYYWGMELYPRILGWDVKMFTNCRAGMMFWAVGVLCFAHKNIEVNGGSLQLGMAVNVALQLVYVTKFFHWEMGYMCSMDIQVDRAGYYLCWGCLVWVPSVYTSHSFYLAEHAPSLSPLAGLTIFSLGLLSIFINYDADNQRYVFRSTGGECLIWGRKPRRIVAEYTTSGGDVRKSLLLVDGWWRVSRHFHYVPEVCAALCWSSPALGTAFVCPYFYIIFLSILLTDRAYRDDDRCMKKYGVYWEQYCREVPYKIVPGLV